MPAQPVPTDTFWAGINYCIVFVLYLPIILIVYLVAENRGESGPFWAVLCVFLPGVGPLVFLIWVIVSNIRSRKPRSSMIRGIGTPDVELSRQRIFGGPEFMGKTHDELEQLIAAGDWDTAEELAKSIIKEAEQTMESGIIADMIGYLNRVKKGRRG